tara:strand:- start:5971 stop:6339 length:369 start_codon:yes stop_codon:yes gene_type:complete
MINIIKLSLIFSIIDAIYLFLMKDNFNKLVSNIQKSPLKLKILPTIFCYIFLIFILYYFIINKNASILDAFLLGLGTYGIYDTTNMAIFKQWNYKTVIIDTIWGGILFSLTYFIYKYINDKY